MINNINSSDTNINNQDEVKNKNEINDNKEQLKTQRKINFITNLPNEVLQRISFYLHPVDYRNLMLCDKKTNEKLRSISDITSFIKKDKINGELKSNYIGLFEKCFTTTLLSESSQKYRMILDTMERTKQPSGCKSVSVIMALVDNP